ncbi:protection of telomeres protein 1a-like [Humulus lupulus]|uniref:protection of telomeres protein 1a-like n=1 Tax=Humulus lupulus TaxID=3486 RepID=UPI002B404279|nr:protection of telomeres protein 1a-like [Humulus lupulus]XP_062099091.1 protection of telomeres protein 1a-like [Humulus lupulus]
MLGWGGRDDAKLSIPATVVLRYMFMPTEMRQNALLGVATNDDGKQVEEDARYRPWVQCCLKSHYLDKSDIWGSRQYRIFGTRLVVIRIDTHCLVCWLEIV